jgi:hypothetical protein
MRVKHNKIVILGGGSAGWITAATLIRYFPKKDITVIESPNIPTVGVGESTTAYMKMFINGHLGLSDEEFLPGVEGVLKMSVRFQDFHKKGDGGFHYPFGRPYFSFEGARFETWSIKKYYYPETPVQDFARSFIPQMALIEKNKISKNELGQFDNYAYSSDLGYHFNANKVGEFLRDSYSVPRGVKVIKNNVKEVITNEDGVESLILENDEVIKADLYIDCSGKKSLLLGDALKEPWVDFSHWLPNNKAWAVPTPYKDVYSQFRPYTNCTALSSGWAWHTPIWSRVGNGYAYCDKYISDEDALEEFKNYLSSSDCPGNFTREEVENLPFFNVPFNAGYYKRAMVKNVVALGLANGFLEPLEGTGLLFVTNPLLTLIKLMQRENLTKYTETLFNMNVEREYHGWRDFLTYFYMFTERDDSKYWKDITEKEYYLDTEYRTKLESSTYETFFNNFSKDETSYHLTDVDGIIYVSKGMNASFDLDESILDRLRFQNDGRDWSEIVEQIKFRQEQDIRRWNKSAEDEMHAYDFTKEHIYKKGSK